MVGISLSKITGLKASRHRQEQMNMFLDGQFAFSLDTETVAREGLKVGIELSLGRIEALQRAAHFNQCLNAAYRYLSYRPRSEAELRGRLQKRGFDDEDIDAVVIKLNEQGLVDDLAFSRFWKDNRESFSPRSQWLTRMELRKKGVSEDIIDQVVSEVNDEDLAYRAALTKARKLPSLDYHSFYRRVGEHLSRRGFGYGAINNAIKKTWRELYITDN
jgi:regulatory protein